MSASIPFAPDFYSFPIVPRKALRCGHAHRCKARVQGAPITPQKQYRMQYRMNGAMLARRGHWRCSQFTGFRHVPLAARRLEATPLPMLLKEPETSVFGTNRTSRAGLMKEVEARKRELAGSHPRNLHAGAENAVRSQSIFLLPSPLVGEGGSIERSEIETGEGIDLTYARLPLTRHGLRPRHPLPQGERGREAQRRRGQSPGPKTCPRPPVTAASRRA